MVVPVKRGAQNRQVAARRELFVVWKFIGGAWLLLCYAWQRAERKKDGGQKNHRTGHVFATKGVERRKIGED
jgi:hypothetical protein